MPWEGLKTHAGYFLYHQKITPVRREIRHDHPTAPVMCTAKCPVNGRNVGSVYCSRCWNYIEQDDDYIVCVE